VPVTVEERARWSRR